MTTIAPSQFVQSLAFAVVGFRLIWNSQQQLSRTSEVVRQLFLFEGLLTR